MASNFHYKINVDLIWFHEGQSVSYERFSQYFTSKAIAELLNKECISIKKGCFIDC